MARLLAALFLSTRLDGCIVRALDYDHRAAPVTGTTIFTGATATMATVIANGATAETATYVIATVADRPAIAITRSPAPATARRGDLF